jgi:uncharacterized membrane-anchored protein YhcB (DUF1043 family)
VRIPIDIPPGYETALVVVLLAVVAALGVCLAVVWMQLQRLEAQQRQLNLHVNAQLRDQFATFNSKLSGQIAKFKQDLEGTEHKLDDTFQRKLEVLDALSEGLRALEKRIGRFADTRSASGFLADLKAATPVFEILDGGRKRSEDASPEARPGGDPEEKSSTGNK